MGEGLEMLLSNTELLSEVERLARLERGFPVTPFFRREFGQWAYREMQSRESLLSAVLEIYRGNIGPYIDPFPSENLAEARRKVGRIQLPLLMSFVNKWNTLYTEEPVRVFEYDGKRLENTDERAQILSELYRKAHINDLLEQADNMLRLTGVVALRPWYDAGNQELVVHLYSANNIRVIENRNNPKRPLAVALVGSYRKEEGDGGATLRQCAEFFTAESMGVLDGDKISNTALETERPPVAFGWEKYPTNKSGFFVDSPGPGLAAIDRLIANDFTSHLGFVTIMQGFGIPVTWGLQKGSTFAVGPDKTIDFDGDPDKKEDLEFKNTGAPLEEISTVIRSIIDWVRECYDIPRSMLDASMTSSGVAQVEANAPLGILRTRRAKQLRPLESDLVKRASDILRASGVFSSSLDPAKVGVSVYYPEPQISKSTDKQIAEDTFQLSHGIITRAEIYMREYPDRFDTEEEAEQFLSQRSSSTVAATGVAVDSPLPSDLSPATPTSTDDVSKEAMNGAQVQALQGLVESVSAGSLPASSAMLVAKNAFPSIPVTDLERMFNEAESFEPSNDSNTLIQEGEEDNDDRANGNNTEPAREPN
jgi:hypothetical protein